MFHRIFSPLGEYITDVPWVDNEDGGLPQWFFELNLIAIEVDIEKDTVEWIPAIGPAPCWKDKFSRFSNNAELFKTFEVWAKEMY